LLARPPAAASASERVGSKWFCSKQNHKRKRKKLKELLLTQMAQPVDSARIASYCPIAPSKNAIHYR